MAESRWTTYFDKDKKILDLNGQNISNADIPSIFSFLTQHPEIVLLNLRFCLFDLDGIKLITAGIAANHTLQGFEWYGSDITDAAMMLLVEAIKINPTLKWLKLGQDATDNNLTYIGMEASKCFAEMLKNKPNLQTLSLPATFGPAGIKNIINVLNQTRLISLDMRYNQLDDTNALGIAQLLGANKTLLELDLGNNKIGPKGIEVIVTAVESSQTLTCLKLDDNQIGELGAVAIDKMLQTNKSLKELSLNFTKLNDQNIIAMMSGLTGNATLTTLSLMGNSEIDINGIKAIATALTTNKTLSKLDLSLCLIPPHNIEKMIQLTQALEKNNTLTSLSLRLNILTDQTIHPLLSLLKTNPILLELDLSNNGISNTGAQTFLDFFKNNTSICRVNLESNMGYPRIDNATQQALDQALQRNKKYKIFKSAVILALLFGEIFQSNENCPFSKLPLELLLMIAKETMPEEDSHTKNYRWHTFSRFFAIHLNKKEVIEEIEKEKKLLFRPK